MLRKRKTVEARIAEMQADLAAEADEVGVAIRIQASVASGRSTARAAQALEREHGRRPTDHPLAMEASYEHHQQPVRRRTCRPVRAGRRVGTTVICSRREPTIRHRIRQFEENLRDAPGRAVPDRGDRSVGNTPPLPRRPDRRDPDLVRSLPTPIRKIIGDLSNTEKTLVGLQLCPAADDDREGIMSEPKADPAHGRCRAGAATIYSCGSCQWRNTTLHAGDRKHQGNWRKTPAWPLRARGDRRLSAGRPGEGRADHRAADVG